MRGFLGSFKSKLDTRRRNRVAVIRSVILFSILAVLHLPAAAQQEGDSFSLNESNPYVFMVFDHFGRRTPFIHGEPDTGVWLRIVNNCRVPILVPTVGPNSKGEIVVLDEVIQSGLDAVEITPGETPASSPRTSSAKRTSSRPKQPLGYGHYSSDVHGFTRIPSGKSLLFSVPLNHLAGGNWYMRVPFSLDIPGSRHGPYSYDSFTVHMPSNSTRQGQTNR